MSIDGLFEPSSITKIKSNILAVCSFMKHFVKDCTALNKIKRSQAENEAAGRAEYWELTKISTQNAAVWH